MRDLKHRLKSSALVGVLCLLLGVSGWSREGKLTDISRPYLGEYRCESLYVGGEDKLGDFDYFRLELSSKGEMKLLYKLKDKEPTEVPLEYDYNSETQEITVRGQWGRGNHAVEGTVGIYDHDGTECAKTEATGHDDLDLIGQTLSGQFFFERCFQCGASGGSTTGTATTQNM